MFSIYNNIVIIDNIYYFSLELVLDQVLLTNPPIWYVCMCVHVNHVIITLPPFYRKRNLSVRWY